MTETVFHKILNNEIPSERVFEDDSCIVIKDINPIAPVHLLCIPKEFIKDISTVSPDNQSLLGHLMLTCSTVAESQGLSPSGYRLVINCGNDAGMEVPYLHIHIIGGKQLSGLA